MLLSPTQKKEECEQSEEKQVVKFLAPVFSNAEKKSIFRIPQEFIVVLHYT